MDWNALGPLSIFLTTLAGGIVWTVDRVDKSRKAKQGEMLKVAEERIADRDKRILDQEVEIEKLKTELRLANVERRSYYQQLRDNDIDPDPTWREPEYV